MRMNKILDIYAFHEFPVSCFATGMGVLDRVGVSVDPENKFCVYDFNKTSEQHKKEYKIVNGHKAIV